jgi:hypothetical protein
MRYPVRIAQQMGPKALLQRPLVTVGTVHSVKGAESDIVFVYPDISFAGLEEWRAGGSRGRSVSDDSE